MNRILLPTITFKNIIADEKRIETAYARLFEIARRNILAKRLLTNKLSPEYTEVQYGTKIFDDRGGGQKATS
jgi:hypothetical protein